MNELTKPSASPNAAAFLVWLLAFSWYAWFLTPGPGSEINSHVDLTSSVALDHHVDLNRYYRNTSDRGCVGRNYISSKSPGISWLAMPSLTYWSFKHVVEPADPWQVWFMALFTTALASALIAALLFLFVHQVSGRDTGAALLASLGYAFATAAFPEATLFSARQPVALMLLILFLMGYSARGQTRCWMATDAVFGFALAMAVTMDYASAVPGAGLTVYYLAARRGAMVAACAGLAAGTLIPLAGWCAYNHAVFGRLIDFASRYPCAAGAFDAAPGLFPSLIKPGRSLLLTSPMIALAAPGLWIMARNRKLQSEAMVLGYAILAACACAIQGNARDLLLILPLCAAPAGLCHAHLPRIWRSVLAGIFFACAVYLFLLTIIPARTNPGQEFFRPTILSGFTHNILVQLAPPAAITIAIGLLLFRIWSRDTAIKQSSNIP